MLRWASGPDGNSGGNDWDRVQVMVAQALANISSDTVTRTVAPAGRSATRRTRNRSSSAPMRADRATAITTASHVGQGTKGRSDRATPVPARPEATGADSTRAT